MLHNEGPLLSIDVGDRETHTEDVDDVLATYIGGRGSRRSSLTSESRSTSTRSARRTASS